MKIDMNVWNQTEAADMGGFKRLPAGGYVCRVEAVREDKSRQGNDEIVLRLDIVEGPYAGYFSRDYLHAAKRFGEQAFWKGTYTQVTVGKSLLRGSSKHLRRQIQAMSRTLAILASGMSRSCAAS